MNNPSITDEERIAIQKSIDHWTNDIISKLEKCDGKDIVINIGTHIIVEDYKSLGSIYSDTCPLCQLMKSLGQSCVDCPLCISGYKCGDEYSEWNKVRKSNTVREALKHARKLRNQLEELLK